MLAYTVRQRTPEIGIRMALGATAADVRALVLRQAAIVVGSGLVVGVVVPWCSDAGCRRCYFRSVRGILESCGTAVLLMITGAAGGVAAGAARLAGGARNGDPGRALTRAVAGRS